MLVSSEKAKDSYEWRFVKGLRQAPLAERTGSAQPTYTPCVDQVGTFARRLEREGEAFWVFLDV